MRELGKTHNEAEFFMNLCQTCPPETIANMAIVLLHQADYLLFRQLERLEKDFLDNGGFSERMMRLRKQQRGYNTKKKAKAKGALISLKTLSIYGNETATR